MKRLEPVSELSSQGMNAVTSSVEDEAVGQNIPISRKSVPSKLNIRFVLGHPESAHRTVLPWNPNPWTTDLNAQDVAQQPYSKSVLDLPTESVSAFTLPSNTQASDGEHQHQHCPEEQSPVLCPSEAPESGQRSSPRSPCSTPIAPENPANDEPLQATLDALVNLLQQAQNQNLEDTHDPRLESPFSVPGPDDSQYISVSELFPSLPSAQQDTSPNVLSPSSNQRKAQRQTLPRPRISTRPHPVHQLQLNDSAAYVPPHLPPQGLYSSVAPHNLHQHPFPAVNHPMHIPGYPYSFNPYMHCPPLPYYYPPSLPPFPPPPMFPFTPHPLYHHPAATSALPPTTDIWSAVFEQAIHSRRQKAAIRKKRKRRGSFQEDLNVENDEICCPFCLRTFVKSNSYALHLKAHRKAAQDMIALNQQAFERSIASNVPGPSSSNYTDTLSPSPFGNSASLGPQSSDSEPTPKRPRTDERVQPTHAEPPAVEITLVEDSSESEQLAEEPTMPGLTYAAPITPMATPPRSTCRASNILWFGADLTPPRERTASNASLDRWHEELFGSDNDE